MIDQFQSGKDLRDHRIQCFHLQLGKLKHRDFLICPKSNREPKGWIRWSIIVYELILKQIIFKVKFSLQSYIFFSISWKKTYRNCVFSLTGFHSFYVFVCVLCITEDQKYHQKIKKATHQKRFSFQFYVYFWTVKNLLKFSLKDTCIGLHTKDKWYTLSCLHNTEFIGHKGISNEVWFISFTAKWIILRLIKIIISFWWLNEDGGSFHSWFLSFLYLLPQKLY